MFRRTWSSKQHTLMKIQTPIAPRKYSARLGLFGDIPNSGTFFSYNGSTNWVGTSRRREAIMTSAWTLTLETPALRSPSAQLARPRGLLERALLGRHLGRGCRPLSGVRSPAGTHSACLKLWKSTRSRGVGRGTRLSNSNTTSSTQDP